MGKRVAILVEDEFEDRELTGPARGSARGRRRRDDRRTKQPASRFGQTREAVTSDMAAGAARMQDFDALVIPGGHAPDRMRLAARDGGPDPRRMDAGKPVAAICHGPQLLISANVLRGRTLTCWPSIAIDVKNAGGLYVDKPVVEDGNLITSRKPDDVPVFIDAIMRALTTGPQAPVSRGVA